MRTMSPQVDRRQERRETSVVRIRSTKPEFWRSGRVASVSWDARLVLKGLESYVDDNGVGRNELALIVGDLFQRDLIREPSRTLARVSEAILELSEAGLLWLYEADGTDLLFVAFWDSIQRIDHPKAGRLPRPDGTMNYKQSVIRESLATSREASRSVAPGTGEQGNRGTGESRTPVVDEQSPGERRTTRNGSELARRNFADIPSRSQRAIEISNAYAASRQSPPTADDLVAIGVQITKALDSGIDEHTIAAGLTEWDKSDSWSPNQIGRFITKAGRASPRPRSTVDDNVTGWLSMQEPDAPQEITG